MQSFLLQHPLENKNHCLNIYTATLFGRWLLFLHCAADVCAPLSLSLSLDKALHSAGISSGFIIFGTNLTNPLNELLLVLQPVSVFSSFMMKR